MSNVELETERLYVVKPSVVVFDDTQYLFRTVQRKTASTPLPVSKKESEMAAEYGVELKRSSIWQNMNYQLQQTIYDVVKRININVVDHTVKFERKNEDITIARREAAGYADVASNKVFFSGIADHHCEREMCVGISKNDKILLARYLWESSFPEIPYNMKIEKYVLALKPFYTREEIMIILEQIKEKAVSKEEKTPKEFTIKKRSLKPIFINSIYSDGC